MQPLPPNLPKADWFAARSGLEAMQAMLAGEISHPPMAQTLNYWLLSVADGEVAFAGVAQSGATNPMGAVHGGWYGAVLDSAMGCAMSASLTGCRHARRNRVEIISFAQSSSSAGPVGSRTKIR